MLNSVNADFAICRGMGLLIMCESCKRNWIYYYLDGLSERQNWVRFHDDGAGGCVNYLEKNEV